ncbi:hypothetical protein FGG08_003455 [Glutinoglossum americanum]|uniref:Vacuolar protein 14 C-terminal Fig4-binding domain-containing protein n=1 Tax=Glutinoglossum americanum TaxID=1670608 RepID=A0A9P8ID64_9PEZI|nr:hypothetical protein FGG08_003455 [Glutinoglossum americanum]
MDASIQRLLNDKLYDKRKVGALELERVVREAANKDHERVRKIIDQLCHEYAYAVHQPHARNGGLIGLAAASIALGPEVARYLTEIVPPVLACFSDQDARVRYYACESMYNIAKVAKGEILLFFNDVFDALCKLAADSELSVKNGAELLDRLIKDIASESAATYVSVLQTPDGVMNDPDPDDTDTSVELPTAFSLARFIPLLKERIHVINPFTRTFLVSWITLLDSIPDLELVFYLPAFLAGLFKFLSDPNRDVHVATQGALERFLAEIRRIARIKRGIEESRRSHGEGKTKPVATSDSGSPNTEDDANLDILSGDNYSESGEDGQDASADGDWIPGQDVHVDHPKILEILVAFLDSTSEEEIRLTALRWIDSFFDICPEDILPFVPRLLSQVLPAMASDVEQVRQAAHRVDTSLMEYIVSLSEEPVVSEVLPAVQPRSMTPKDVATLDRRDSTSNTRGLVSSGEVQTPPPASASPNAAQGTMDLDYATTVSALTLQFLNEHEATRVAALTWLIMLHRKAPRKVLAINDGTFPALLKTLSDPAEAVVTRDLQLLSQISRNSDDDYFYSFMVNLLQLFCTDRKLLETRGNLIIRQLCVSLSAERIYRTLADCLEKDEDVEFASIMVQNLNNNLITAPELADLRKRLKNLETRDGQTFFVALFRSWCHNAVATFSLCLLAQAYEQAYNLLQIFAELEMTVNMLIQIDKLVQLLESPVFTYLRLQLLEPEKYPYLYKCLYGLLMLLPQSSAFAALKNRLNSVSGIGYLHTAPRATPIAATSNYERPNRLKGREDGGIKWVELLEKFKSVQEKARRQQRQSLLKDDAAAIGPLPDEKFTNPVEPTSLVTQGRLPGSGSAINVQGAPQPTASQGQKPKSGLGHLGRLSGAVGGRKTRR